MGDRIVIVLTRKINFLIGQNVPDYFDFYVKSNNIRSAIFQITIYDSCSFFVVNFLINFFFFVFVHIYPPFMRKRIVSL